MRKIDCYNNMRLHTAIDCVAPIDKLEGRADQILAERDRKRTGPAAQASPWRQADRLDQCPEKSDHFMVEWIIEEKLEETGSGPSGRTTHRRF